MLNLEKIMVTTVDVRAVVRALKEAIDDFNYWPSSESDSPLRIAARKGVLDDKAILGLDASMRRKQNSEVAGYKVPSDRVISKLTFAEKIWPIVQNALAELKGIDSEVSKAIEIERTVEAAEFLIQVFNQFNSCANPACYEVSSPSEPYTSFFICGEGDRTGEQYTAIASTLLVTT